MKIPTILPVAMGTVLLSLLLAGCSTKPVDELKMTTEAMNDAMTVEASKYAPKQWDRAQSQWQEANALIQLGRYSEARSVFVDAIASYKEAQDEAKRNVENLQIEVKALQSSAETEMEKIEKELKSSKVKPSVRMRVEDALPGLYEKISMMNVAFDAGDFLMARIDGQEAVRYMDDLQKKLDAGK
jgi:outer membrane PBP1 activator LpoA protein